MKHIVDNVNKMNVKIKTVDLAGRVPCADSIELLCVELHFAEEYENLSLALVRYARDGVEKANGLPFDLRKKEFVTTVPIQEAGLKEELQKIGPEISRIIFEDLAMSQYRAR